MGAPTHIVAVTALIKDQTGEKFLVVKRGAHEVKHPGKWALPGGKAERGETMIDVLRREMQEEVGLDIEDQLTYLRDFTFDRAGQNVIGLCFEVIARPGEVKLAEEFDDFKWVTPEEFETLDAIEQIKQEVVIAFRN